MSPSTSSILDEVVLISGQSQRIQWKIPQVRVTSTETSHSRRMCTQSISLNTNSWSVEIIFISYFSWTSTCKWLDFQRFLVLRTIDRTACLANSMEPQRGNRLPFRGKEWFPVELLIPVTEYLFMWVACTVFGNDFFEGCCVGTCYWIAREVGEDFKDMVVMNCNEWKATEQSGYKEMRDKETS